MTITDTTFQPHPVQGVRLYQMRHIEDADRGNLTVGEFGRDLPFKPERYFITYGIPSGQTRGAHAHKECGQFVLCVCGRCSVAVDDGTNREVFGLNHPNVGVYIPPLVWATEFNHSADAALLIFASRPYEPEDYVQDYEVFQALAKAAKIHGCSLPIAKL